MMKKLLIPALLLGVLLPAAGPAAALGVPGAVVALYDQGTTDCVYEPGTTTCLAATTDAEGAFVFENLAAGTYRLEADDALAGRSAAIDFAIDPTIGPARLRGLVEENDLATASFAVTAFATSMDFVDVVVADGYPRVQPKWNRRWTRSSGKLHVRIAGTGLEAVTEVSLASAIGLITATRLVFDPVDGKLHAIFPKGAAFESLAGPDAQRGDTVALQVGVTTPAGTQLFDASARIVGPRK